MKRLHRSHLILALLCASLCPWAASAQSDAGTPGSECDDRARLVLEHCLGSGASPDGCRALAQAVLTACRDAAHPCLAQCHGSVREAVQACLDSDRDPELCRRIAETMRLGCRTRCLPPEPCRDRCAQRGELVVSTCLGLGRGDDECRPLGRASVEACLGACHPPCPPPCAAYCQERAHAARHQCLQRGGTPQACEARAVRVLSRCLERCPPPPDCGEACDRRAAEILQRCLQDGGPREECEARAARFRAECESRCSAAAATGD